MFALLPVPLWIVFGYGGQDFSFHVASWLELHNAWQAHEWRLGWSDWAQFGFGEPRFCFYPPLSFLLGAGLSFLLPLPWLPGAMAFLLLAASGLSMYAAAGVLLGPERRLPAALLYMFNPYLLTTLVLRFAIAEAWVQALLPLTFLAFYAAAARGRGRAIVAAAFLFAFGWLTNLPEAIAIFYAFGMLAVVLAVVRRSFRPVAVFALSQALALGLSAFRLLPTFLDQRFISAKALLHYDYRPYLRPWKLPPPQTLNLICVLFVLVGLVLVLLAVRSARERKSSLSLSLAVLAGFAVFVQLPLSTLLWAWLPEFKFVLFPFRFLPLLSLSVVLFLSSIETRPALRKGGAAMLVLLALLPFVAFFRLLPFQRFSDLREAAASWRGGLEGVREYVPAGVAAYRSDPGRESALRGGTAFEPGPCRPTLLRGTPNGKWVGTDAPAPCTLTLHTFGYPFWRASLRDGTPLPTGTGADGLLTAAIPSGPREIVFRFVPKTRVRRFASVFSLLLLVLLLASAVRGAQGSRPPRFSS